MSLIALVITLIVIGVLLGLANRNIDMDPKIKNILNSVVVLVVLVSIMIWLLSAFGVLSFLSDVRVPTIR